MSQATVSKLFIYPIKSLVPMELTSVEIGIHSLKHDRIFAIMSEDGRYINSKRTGKVNQLKATYDLEHGLVHLSHRNETTAETFELRIDNLNLNNYLENFFEMKLHLIQSDKGELLDVPYRSSATLISTATYNSLLQDFPTHSLEDFRLRFRANIEISGVPAFWEEQLIKSPTEGMNYKIAEVNMIAMGLRDRCNVPPRKPFTGETDKTFIKRMMASREKSLPMNSPLPQFDNLYYLSVDTYLPPTEKGKIIRIGDVLQIDQPIDLSRFS